MGGNATDEERKRLAREAEKRAEKEPDPRAEAVWRAIVNQSNVERTPNK